MMENALIKAAIEKFDLIGFLDEQNISYSESGKNIGQGWIGISECPFCGIGNNHFGIHRETKLTNCWNCVTGKTNLVGFVAQILGVSYKEAETYILGDMVMDYEDLENVVSNIFNQENEKPKETTSTTHVKLPHSIKISKQIINTKSHIRDFFEKRGLDYMDATVYNLRVGLEGLSKNKLIIPIHDNENLIGYQLRSFINKFYQNIGNIKQYLYNYSKIPPNSKIILVEGFFDYTSTDKFIEKYYKGKYYVTTGFSKIITESQIKLLNDLKPKQIIYFLDRDAWMDYDKTCHDINCDTSFIVPPAKKGDPGNMNHLDFLKLFKENGL